LSFSASLRFRLHNLGLNVVPSVSLLGLSALGMVLVTSALVMLGVFIFLMIQRRKKINTRVDNKFFDKSNESGPDCTDVLRILLYIFIIRLIETLAFLS
jgi:hypothetical protein